MTVLQAEVLYLLTVESPTFCVHVCRASDIDHFAQESNSFKTLDLCNCKAIKPDNLLHLSTKPKTMSPGVAGFLYSSNKNTETGHVFSLVRNWFLCIRILVKKQQEKLVMLIFLVFRMTCMIQFYAQIF